MHPKQSPTEQKSDEYESLPFGFDIGCDDCNEFYHEKCLLLKYGYDKTVG